MQNTGRPFSIVVHDVAPPFISPITTILGQLKPLVQGPINAALVPNWHGESPAPATPGFGAFVRTHFDEVLLHGYTHCRNHGGSLLSCLTHKSDEFSGSPGTEAIERLRRGQAVMAELLGEPARGFIPPAWQRGPITLRLLSECGLHYCVGLTGIECANGRRIPLSTWSWDAGVIAELGYLGEATGAITFAVRRRALPCVVFHPVDVRRGHLPRGLRLVQAFLAKGRQPATFRDIVFHYSGIGLT